MCLRIAPGLEHSIGVRFTFRNWMDELHRTKSDDIPVLDFTRRWVAHWTGRAAIALAAVTFIYSIWQIVGAAELYTRAVVSDLSQAMMATVAAIVTVVLAKSENLDVLTRRAWKRVAIAYSIFALAQIGWFFALHFFRVRPFPSLADLGFLAFYPMMMFALLSFPTAEQTHLHRRKFVLDTLCVMVAGTTVVWYFIVLPTLAADAAPLKIALNVAYIVSDLVLLLGITTILLRRPPEHVRRSLMIVVGGLVMLLFADTSFAFVTLHGLRTSGPLVVLWVVGPFLLAAASLHQLRLAELTNGARAPIGPDIFQPTFSWIPYVAIVIGYGVLVYSAIPYSNEPHGLIVLSALILTAVVVLRQITAVKENIRLHAVQAQRESELHFRTLIENSSDIVMIFDMAGRISYQSPSVERILGYKNESLIGRSAISFIHADDKRAMTDAWTLLTANPDSEVMRESRFIHADGSWRVLEGIAKIITDEESGTHGILLNARDVNERKALESKIIHQAFHDPLTNLANRLLFKSRVEEALITAADGDYEVGVLFLDLDDFKNINDTLGHDAGDKLLVEFTEKLRLCVRARDTVARLGGDEFAILIEGEEVRDKAISIARRVLENVAQPFNILGSDVKIGISVGIAQKEDDETTADDLLRNADVAMYTAKGKGKNRFVVFESEMHRSLLAQIELEKDLRAAIENNEFRLNFQPIFNLRDGQITGTEALVRWTHPVRGAVPPSEFIGIAEQCGLIVPLGRWVIIEACRHARRFTERHDDRLTVTINISGKQLEHADFIDELASIILTEGVRPESIILEITESTMMEDTESILRLLTRIKSLGIKLAIDDFGTGYSSLSYLQQFPIDILKIDRSFVDGIEGSTQKNAVARTIISLSDTLQLATVAEGIENNEQAEVLRELGCDYGQGYFFSRPLSAEDFEELIAAKANVAVYAGDVEVSEFVGGPPN